MSLLKQVLEVNFGHEIKYYLVDKCNTKNREAHHDANENLTLITIA